MKAIFNINYRSGDKPVKIIEKADQLKNITLKSVDNQNWVGEFDITREFRYKYCVGEEIEFGKWRRVDCEAETVIVYDQWREITGNKELYSSFYENYIFCHEPKTKYGKVVVKVTCEWIKKNEVIAIVGASEKLGQWNIQYAKKLDYTGDFIWAIALDRGVLKEGDQYKFVVLHEDGTNSWEEGENRVWKYDVTTLDGLQISDLKLNMAAPKARVAGVAIPVFSLRSEDSVGIGDFGDMAQFVRWVAQIGGKVVQILPINDTTASKSWRDSYPYSAISIYALHPLYLSLEKMGVLEDVELAHHIADEQQKLNGVADLDYQAVEIVKTKFFKTIYEQDGRNTLESIEFQKFFDQNKYWIIPYALFCHLRDVNGSVDFNKWGQWSKYHHDLAIRMISIDSVERSKIMYYAFLQFHLDKQLKETRQIAKSVGVALKGDIPIGVCRHSVETWVEPHLFNMNEQAGAPPDDFAINGQNWGFPTYNWEEMAKDGYKWWKKRFEKMTDYFDLYRIDHILGFFRIWQIPIESVQGLLGQFNPAIPFDKNQLCEWEFEFDENKSAKPFIHKSFLEKYLGKSFVRYKEFLQPIGNGLFEFKPEVDTQSKIQKYIGEQNEELKQALFGLTNEVLFVRDRYNQNCFHPRIEAQKTMAFKCLNQHQQWKFNEIYNYFFYHRNEMCWEQSAMKKLPKLIDATNMLCCAEDLGMIPNCVAKVMDKLNVITLEVERMPKNDRLFANTAEYNYLSVCTTSTHDMSPIRLFWTQGLEDGTTQKYYNQVVGGHGEAPKIASTDICKNIIWRHLESPSILAILPLQDLLAIDEKLRREDPTEEQINVPADPNNYWKYRMHISIEKLKNSDQFNETVKKMMDAAGRI